MLRACSNIKLANMRSHQTAKLALHAMGTYMGGVPFEFDSWMMGVNFEILKFTTK